MSGRTALILGNSNYETANTLPNAIHDAQDLADRLKRFGFVTQRVTDATNKQMDRALKSFRKSLRKAEVALVFFAGHGLQIADENFLIAVDTDLEDDISARHSSLPLNRVIDALDCSIETMLKRVRNTLNAATEAKQVSWEHTSLAGEFYFNRSVALKVDRYSATALRDKLFVLEENKKSHKLIAYLKSRDFGTQNAAIDHFDSDNFARVAKDTLFAIGHKMYQAADDNAFAAKDFIRDFPQLAQGSQRKNGELC